MMTRIATAQTATIIPFPIRHRAAAAIAQPAPQDLDAEERRWQLEWERRNIQD